MTNRQRQRVLEMGDVLFFDGVAGCNDADFPCFMISALDAYGHVRCLAYALGDSVKNYVVLGKIVCVCASLHADILVYNNVFPLNLFSIPPF